MNEQSPASETLVSLGRKIIQAIKENKYTVLEIPDRRTSTIV
jgi:hypothetical protein